jgi:ribosomal protein S18 acetylase RimI-like enzyme
MDRPPVNRPPVNVVEFAPLAAGELAEFFKKSRDEFVERGVAVGEARDALEARADAMQARILPGGRLHSDHHPGHLVAGGDVVGHIWVARAEGESWYVWDVEIDPAQRGRGLGRAAMELANEMARADDALTIGLSVLATNQTACQLFRSIGYEEVGRNGPLLSMRAAL